MSSQRLTVRVLICFLLSPVFLSRAAGDAQRVIFAHYMLANQDYAADDPSGERNIAAYEREIQQAQAIGIDGFALNAGGWLREPRYIRRAAEMFEAALRLHSPFKLMFSADMCCSNDAEDVEDMIRRFAGNSRYAAIYFRKDGRAVVTTFAGSNSGREYWEQIRADLETGTHPSEQTVPGVLAAVSGVPSSGPLQVLFVPAFFWGGELPNQKEVNTGIASWTGILDGAFYWGIAAVPGLGHVPDQLPSSHAYAVALHGAGKLYMAPICFQFWGANHGRDYEYGGFAGMRAMWMDAIQVTHPEWVEIITWNDFVEGTYVSPIDDPARYAGANDLGAGVVPPSTLHFYHSHRGATELLAYYIEWYKSGRQPVIHRDEIFWAYRSQLIAKLENNSAARSMKIYGPLADVIYVTANLKEPATLRVSFGSKTTSIALPDGSTDVQIPILECATPRFVLTRGASSIAAGDGDDAIAPSAPMLNLYFSTGYLRH